MIKTCDYWILENKFVFKPSFNKSINKYYNLIKNYDELIFSNYNDINFCIKKIIVVVLKMKIHIQYLINLSH